MVAMVVPEEAHISPVTSNHSVYSQNLNVYSMSILFTLVAGIQISLGLI